MPRFPDVVRAPPERVWKAVVDVQARARWPKVAQEARIEKGTPGSVGAVATYKGRRGEWHETILEAEKPSRLVLEVRDGAQDRPAASWVWRLEAIQLGTLLVLDVQGKGFSNRLLDRYVRKYWYRRLVGAVKREVEGPPPSLVDTAAAATTPEPPADEKAEGPAEAGATPKAPPARRAGATPKKARAAKGKARSGRRKAR